jgi:hypothetical protein
VSDRIVVNRRRWHIGRLAAKRLDPDSEQGGLDAVLPQFTSAFRELLSATGLTTRDCAGLAISTCGCGFRADANSFQP